MCAVINGDTTSNLESSQDARSACSAIRSCVTAVGTSSKESALAAILAAAWASINAFRGSPEADGVPGRSVSTGAFSPGGGEGVGAIDGRPVSMRGEKVALPWPPDAAGGGVLGITGGVA